MRDHHYLGSVSCTGDNRTEFQTGDVIGYHHGTPLRYQLWSIDSNGYTTYFHRDTISPLNTFTIISNDVQSANNRQPLIEVMYGKITHSHKLRSFQCYFWVMA